MLSSDSLADSLSSLYRTGEGCLRKNDGKLFPAIPCGEVDFAASGANRCGDGRDDHVTARMAKSVIDLLQKIEIDHQKRQWMIVALSAAQLDGKSRLKEPMIGQSG